MSWVSNRTPTNYLKTCEVSDGTNFSSANNKVLSSNLKSDIVLVVLVSQSDR